MNTRHSSGVVLFAQVNSFSYTNDALQESLKPHLGEVELEPYRIYPVIRRNPILLTISLAAVIYNYGIMSAFDRKGISEKLIKTPTFFKMASFLIRRRAKKIKNLRAVLQTQGLFNGKSDGIPLFIYTDNTILNKINKISEKIFIHDATIYHERKLYNDAEFIAVSATHVASSLIEDYGIPSEAVRNILIGANSPVPEQANNSRYSSGKILFVGIDWERKGGPDLLAAFRKVLKRLPDSRLTIVGSSPEVFNLPEVEVLGKVPRNTVSELMKEAAIYCMPSYVEPSSVAVIEAASSGLPIVATAVGGFLDSVRNEETGLLVKPGDIDALANSLERLLRNPELCARYGDAGKRLMLDFRWDTVSEKLALEMKKRI